MSSRPDLQTAAAETMRAHGFEPEFSDDARREAAAIAQAPPILPGGDLRDVRSLLWSSIDNDTSRDLDQIEVADPLPNGETRVRIGIADVDAFVPKGSAIDKHAAAATTSVYAGVKTFPMLPEALSTGVTSLLGAQERAAVVIEFVVSSDGSVRAGEVYRALVRNSAQLTYDAVGAWLDGHGPVPPAVASVPGLEQQLRLQDTCAQTLRHARYLRGALNIETVETRPILREDRVVDLVAQPRNRATELIEDFMIAANEVVASLLETKHVSSIRRVVKTPSRWNRIVEMAHTFGYTLPIEADSKALNEFLIARKTADPDHFADLSLAVIKLMGPGEYVLDRPGDPETGHFGLAVQDYTHSTAPNRRFADLVTQRLIKAVIAGRPAPYTDDELADIARQCTLKEDAARKVEREMSKRIAAVAMSRRIGESFDAIVTGVTPRGTFVRVLAPHVEGLLARGQGGVDVGDRLRVTLIHTDPARGYIDFAHA